MVSFLTTLFLGKPSGSSLSILLPETDNLLFVNQPLKREMNFLQKNMPDTRVDLKTTCIQSRRATNQTIRCLVTSDLRHHY